MKRFSRCKYYILFIAASLVLTVGVGTTFALLKVQAKEVTNVFNAAKINVQVVEQLPDGSGVQGSDQNQKVDFGVIRKNQTISKVVCIENKHSDEYPTTDTFVRCRIVPILRDADGNNIAENIQIRINQDNLPGSGWKVGYDKTGSEKYYYWTSILPRGEKTGNLFEQVTAAGDIPEGAHLELQVLVDAVQARPYPPSGFDLLSKQERDKAGAGIPSYQAWGWFYDGEKLSNQYTE